MARPGDHRPGQDGLPEVGSVEGMKAAAAKAKSFVSCAIGRIDNATAPRNEIDSGRQPV